MTRRSTAIALVVLLLTPAAPAQAATVFRVFATREGLVGGQTANQHVIRERDHFVALPSRRALSPQRSGAFTVRVCASNGRCEWAPVWDVGPWNTKDDYWSDDREMWPDLPVGLPQAQAAYQDGHNEGHDQFGRTVTSPAGIDLADGTFWDGLRLNTNAWVSVLFLWTTPGPFGTVRATVSVHNGPTSAAPEVGLAAEYAQVPIVCALPGEQVGGSDTWYRISTAKYVAAAHVTGAPDAPWC
jgi:hypothetical protein